MHRLGIAKGLRGVGQHQRIVRQQVIEAGPANGVEGRRDIHSGVERYRRGGGGAQRLFFCQRHQPRALARHQPDQIRPQRQRGGQRQRVGKVALDQLQLQLQLADDMVGMAALAMAGAAGDGDLAGVGHDVDDGVAVADAAADARDMGGAQRRDIRPAQQGRQRVAGDLWPQHGIGRAGALGRQGGLRGGFRMHLRPGKQDVPFLTLDGGLVGAGQFERLFAPGRGAGTGLLADAQGGARRVKARIGGVEIGGDEVFAAGGGARVGPVGVAAGWHGCARIHARHIGQARVLQQAGQHFWRGGQLDLGLDAHAGDVPLRSCSAIRLMGNAATVCHKAKGGDIGSVPVPVPVSVD